MLERCPELRELLSETPMAQAARVIDEILSYAATERAATWDEAARVLREYYSRGVTGPARMAVEEFAMQAKAQRSLAQGPRP